MIEWRPVKGFEGKFEVSNDGKVKSLPWQQIHSKTGKVFLKKERLLKIRFGSSFNGYSSVAIQGKSYFHHRVIAEAFIPNPDNKPCVNHKNGIKTDNRIENLEWVTKSENSIHSFAIGLQSNKGDKHPGHKLTESEVLSIRLRYSLGESSWKIFKSIGRISYTNIKDIIAKRIWSHL